MMNKLNIKKTTCFKRLPVARIVSSTLAMLSIFFASTAFAALGQTEVDNLISDLGYSSATPVKQIHNYRVDGFNAVNGDSVVINAGPKQKYLITFMTRCHDIQFSQKIGFTSTLSNLTKFDNIVVSNRGTGREICPIKDIYKLEV